MTAMFFNLFVNSTFSLLVGLTVVSFCLWLFRVETGHWKLYLLSLPFVKIVYDLICGIPANSLLYSNVDPFALPMGRQSFAIGAGLSQWGPTLQMIFSVNGLDGQVYGASVGDYLLIWTQKKFGSVVPLILLAASLAVSAVLMGIRLFQAVRFEWARRQDRLHARTLEIRRQGWRQVDVYISSQFAGSPFTGGIWRPYICIPEDTWQQLTSDELNSVIAHELGHIQYFDLLVTLLVQILGDLFWFIPGYRRLSRKIDRLRELVADQSAVKMGADPLRLSSALIKLKEIPETNSKFILYSAFFREKSLLKERVQRLLGSTRDLKPRWGWNRRLVRWTLVFWTTCAVMFSTFGGNTEVSVKDTDFVQRVLRSWGFE